MRVHDIEKKREKRFGMIFLLHFRQSEADGWIFGIEEIMVVVTKCKWSVVIFRQHARQYFIRVNLCRSHYSTVRFIFKSISIPRISRIFDKVLKDGFPLFVSIPLIVRTPTPEKSAKSCCVIPSNERRSFIFSQIFE